MSRSSPCADRTAIGRRRSAGAWLATAVTCVLAALPTEAGASPRRTADLREGWRTALATTIESAADCTTAAFDDTAWRTIDVPHSWDTYEGARQVRHGNLHGAAWYRRSFTVLPGDIADGRRVFLFFEGVGSYATVWVNGREIGHHAGGLTTFTLDATDAVRIGADNLLVVRADHPAGIRDLPWVCGGCELVYGFSEGPQPFGIFRPVWLVSTAPIRIEPFGVHLWNEASAGRDGAQVHVRTEVRHHGDAPATITVVTRLLDADGAAAGETRATAALAPGATLIVAPEPIRVASPRLWSPADPHRYTATTEILAGATLVDRETTTFGVRTVAWPDPDGPPGRPLLINGEPVFLNGTCDYEHNLGANHAFTDEQVAARAAQILAAGFNAFRDAHHPHNLRFNAAWDRAGTLWWTQFGAQIWFDRDDFRENYTRLLRQWVKERRNSPSLILWGLQNESKLPAAFAEACAAVIREMDPTASTQRLITTCNGGKGTDWNVPQNWSGTYGGDPFAYADDLLRQRLVGEYGAWRSLGLHSEPAIGAGPPAPDDPSRFRAHADGPLSEERLNALFETKIRLAESVRDRVIGHFLWPFTTHANPGRNFGEHGEQLFDGFRPLDRIGPANNKGLLTLWGEPTDAYHLFRANYTDARTHPMVVILSRTWPHRWSEPGLKDAIVVLSNCDEVELFNDLGQRSLGVRTRAGRGTHFRWDGVRVEYNLLRAEGRIGGRVVATDAILLHHLPPAPRHVAANEQEPDILAPIAGHAYLHRINCGGPAYIDTHGNPWAADRGVSVSWTTGYSHLPAAFGSQRRLHEPIAGTRDDTLFQTYRYGRDRLRYTLPVPDGEHVLDLFFTEPWYLPGGGADCAGWRLFDIAVNGTTVVRDLDIWRESGGHARALRRSVPVTARDGAIELSFPRVAAGQAVLSAIAVRSRHAGPATARAAPRAIGLQRRTHLDLGDRIHSDAPDTLATLPAELLEADHVPLPAAHANDPVAGFGPIPIDAGTEVLIAHDTRIAEKPDWLREFEPSGEHLTTVGPHSATFALHRRTFDSAATLHLAPNVTRRHDGPVSMYLVLLQQVRALPPPQFVSALTVHEASGWSAHGHVKSGQRPYTDRPTRLVALPAAFGDADWLRTSHDRATSVRATFTAPVHVEVGLALDARLATPPGWLENWIPTTWIVRTDTAPAPRLVVHRRRFNPGDTIELGPNGTLPDGGAAAMYAVLVRPVRASATFDAAPIDATTCSWPFTVAVGDRYGLNIRHRTAAGSAPFEAGYTIIARADGAEVCSGRIELATANATDGWRIARARTCASLNAGDYLLRVHLPDNASPVTFDSLEIE